MSSKKSKKKTKKKLCCSKKKGFTLLEVLLVVAAIAILAGIVILAINPNKQIGETRNDKRRSDVNTILNAAYQYSIDNRGNLPAAIPEETECGTVATNEICKGDTADCTDLVDLSVLTANGKYVVSIPADPTGSSTNGTGYFIRKDSNGRVNICAPSAEQSVTISLTK